MRKGDRFKIVYSEKYINDTIYAGVKDIKAAIFEHNKKEFYAFDFKVDVKTGLSVYYDEEVLKRMMGQHKGKGLKGKGLTVEDIGGLECNRCHY